MARIAIVDDSRLARTFTASCLKKAGHEPIDIEPSSIFDALNALKTAAPDLILSDYLMPHCPGMSLVRSCREDAVLSKAKIIVITAHHDDDVQEKLTRLGADAFLHKPFEPQVLLDAIQGLLG